MVLVPISLEQRLGLAGLALGQCPSLDMIPSENPPRRTLRTINAMKSFMTAGLTVAQINQFFTAPAYSCRGGEAVGTGRWLNGLHGGRSRSRSSPRSWPGAISTVPA